MNRLIKIVLTAGLPKKVGSGYAAEMPVAAGVRCIGVLRRWRGAVSCLANAAANELGSRQIDHSVPLHVFSERPEQALIGGMRHDRRLIVEPDLTFRQSRFPTLERVAMSGEAHIVRVTQIFCVERLAAIRDGAYSFISHLDLRRVGLDRARRRLPGRGAFVVCRGAIS